MSRRNGIFQVEQLGAPKGPRGRQVNESVSDLESLVTHHPKSNRHIHLREGEVQGAEDQQPAYRGGDRSYAFISGEFQETIDATTDRYGSLKPHQVLVVKDFILEDPAPPPGRSPRAVSVPSPVEGVVSRVRTSGGMVEIMDLEHGDVVARVRHLDPVAVEVGDTVLYGQSLGIQNNRGLGPRAGVHVHIEMDTRYYQQFEHYIDDLVSGRLAIEAEHRKGVTAQPVVDDTTFRLGQSGEPVATVQRALVADGYRATGDRPIAIDGVYRPDMQGALLAFQQDHRIPRTGDIDPATVQLALRVNLDKPLGPMQAMQDPGFVNGLPHALRDIQQGLDPAYTVRPWQPPPDAGHPADPARTQRTPVHHAHPGHEPARLLERAPDPTHPDHPDHALLMRIRAGVRELDQEIGKAWDTSSERLGASLFVKAKESGFSGRDEIALVLNESTATLPAGALVHMERRGPHVSADPAANWTHVRTVDAVATPSDESYRKADTLAALQPTTSTTRGPGAIEPATAVSPQGAPSMV